MVRTKVQTSISTLKPQLPTSSQEAKLVIRIVQHLFVGRYNNGSKILQQEQSSNSLNLWQKLGDQKQPEHLDLKNGRMASRTILRCLKNVIRGSSIETRRSLPVILSSTNIPTLVS